MFEKAKARKNAKKIEKLQKELEKANKTQEKLTKPEPTPETAQPLESQPIFEIPPPQIMTYQPPEKTKTTTKTTTGKKKPENKPQTPTQPTPEPTQRPQVATSDIEPPLPSRSEKYDPKENQKWTVKLKDKFWPDRSLLINMEMFTGNHTQFVIHTQDQEFNYAGGTYYIDTTLKYWVTNAKMYALDYHQGFSMPIQRIIRYDKVDQAIQASGLCEVEAATNPKNLEAFIKSKVIEQLMKAQEITEFFKSIKFMIIILLLLNAINFLLMLKNSGALQKIPGLGG